MMKRNRSELSGVASERYSANFHQFWRIAGLAIFLTLVSCGSVHQMIPPRPLAPGEFRGSFIIGYDFNRFAPASSMGINFYWGAGNDYNLGFGYEPPLGISHITAVKYFNTDKTKYENLYASINGVMLTTDYSPNLEMGASYIVRDSRSIHSFSSGLWFLIDNDMTEPIWKMLFWRSIARSQIRPGARPFITYEFLHNDLIFSVRNNFGLTEKAINWKRRQLDQRDKISIPNLDISYITFDALSQNMQIELKNSMTYRITRNYPYLDALVPGVDIDKYRLKRFTREDSIGYYYVLTLRPDPHSSGNRIITKSELYELNYDKILSDYADKQDIFIGSYPERTEGILNKIHWYKHDWSIGVGSAWGKSR